MKMNVFFFLFFFITLHFACPYKTDDDLFFIFHAYNIPPYIDFFFVSITVLLGAFCRHIVIKWNLPIPYDVFVLIVGFLIGIIMHNNDVAKIIGKSIHVNPHDALYMYLPILIFNIAFCTDCTIFLKTLPQIVVISIPVAVTTSVAFGAIMRMVIDQRWSGKGGIIFGCFASPTYPASIIHILKKQSFRTKRISVLLEGEAMFSIIFIDMFHDILMSTMMRYIQKWYQPICLLLRFILVGLLVGYLMGLLGRTLLRKMYANRYTVFVFALAVPLFTHAVSDVYLSGCGVVSVAVAGLMMSQERASLPADIDEFLVYITHVVTIILDIFFCITCSALFVVDFTMDKQVHDYVLLFVTYIVHYAVRFLGFLIFLPLIKRLGYGMDMKNMMICVWSGVKNPLSLILVEKFLYHRIRRGSGENYYFHITGLIFLSKLINGSLTGTLMKFLEMKNISMARQINMNNCIRHIFNKRERTIAVLKMDRFLTDTNWPLVIQATTINHPYHVELKNEEEDMYFSGYHLTSCPDCQKDIQADPTPKQFRELIREARLRVLKSKKMSYSRQYVNGMISKETILYLTQIAELAMDSDEALIDVKDVTERFTKEGVCTKFIRERLHEMKKNRKTANRPRKYIRRICHRIVLNRTWEKYMLYIVGFQVLGTIALTIYQPYLNEKTPHSRSRQIFEISLIIIKTILTTIYLLEVWMKILAYSWLWIWEHGVKTYFRSVWNIFDFLTVLVMLGYTTIDITHLTPVDEPQLVKVFDILVWIRAVRLLRILEFCLPKMMGCLNRKVDTQMAFTYEMEKSYSTGETEILDMLPYMIDNKDIRSDLKVRIENDRLVINKILGDIQKERPWVAITVKTKQAIRNILRSMNDAIMQLKISGWVDTYEQDKLEQAMHELYKQVNAIKKVPASPPKVIFDEVIWMSENKQISNYLFDHVIVKKFEPGDIVFGDGSIADGIYIVVTGLFVLRYIPDTEIISHLHEFGQLPIVDYLTSNKFEEQVTDYIVSGNCIGALSILTGRHYNCTITADTHSQVYVLKREILEKAMELEPDPLNGLECKIWKEVGIRITIPLLLSVPAYQNFSQDQIKYALETAFMPKLSSFKIFSVTEMIQDIVLIEGVVADFNTRELFIAPCYIPRTVQKLILPKSSLMNISIAIETKLLIIPEKDVDEYDIMLLAEETCEFVITPSASTCLQHLVQKKSSMRRRIQMQLSSSTSSERRKKQIVGEPKKENTEDTVDTSALGDRRSNIFEEDEEQEIVNYYHQTFYKK